VKYNYVFFITHTSFFLIWVYCIAGNRYFCTCLFFNSKI